MRWGGGGGICVTGHSTISPFPPPHTTCSPGGSNCHQSHECVPPPPYDDEEEERKEKNRDTEVPVFPVHYTWGQSQKQQHKMRPMTFYSNSSFFFFVFCASAFCVWSEPIGKPCVRPNIRDSNPLFFSWGREGGVKWIGGRGRRQTTTRIFFSGISDSPYILKTIFCLYSYGTNKHNW